MATKYNFETTEKDGTEYIIAQPRTDTGEPVRLEADWVSSGDIEGEWERAVRAMIKTDLMGGMELEEGNGRIDRRKAIETLANAEDEQGSIVTGEEQAEALVEYFAEHGVLEIDGNEVILLRNPTQEDISPEMMLNWAASIDACVEKINDTIDRVQRAKEQLDDHLDKLETDTSDIDERLEETAQELRSLGDGAGVPTDPSSLSEEERSRYEQLEREFLYHKQMKEVEQTELVERVKSGANKLAQNIEMLKSARNALDSKREEVRTMALHQNVFPEDAINIVENMGNLASTLAGLGDVDERVAETQPDELGQMVDDVLGDVSEVTETAQQTAPEEEEAEETTDYQV